MDYDHQNDDGSQRVGRGMLWFAAIAALGLLTWLFSGVEKNQRAILQSASGNGIVLQQDYSGHYRAEGFIDETPVTFLVDTGATDVAIPESLARRIGLEFGPPITLHTAAGRSSGWLTRIDRVRLGSIQLTNVKGTIASELDGDVLLGMSFLKHFSLRQEGEQLTIENL